MTLQELCFALSAAKSPDPWLDSMIHWVAEERAAHGERANLEGEIEEAEHAPAYTAERHLAERLLVDDMESCERSPIAICLARMEYEEAVRRSLIPFEES